MAMQHNLRSVRHNKFERHSAAGMASGDLEKSRDDRRAFGAVSPSEAIFFFAPK